MKNIYSKSLLRKMYLHIYTIKSVFNNNFDKYGDKEKDFVLLKNNRW